MGVGYLNVLKINQNDNGGIFGLAFHRQPKHVAFQTNISYSHFVHLNLQTDYGLRILMLLAASDRQMSVDEVARSYGISRNHLAKVAQRLQALGYITTARGRGGGLKLAISADRLNVGAIVRELESLDSFVECMSPQRNTCPAVGVCGLQGALKRALNDFLLRLDRYTIADLLPNSARFFQSMKSVAPRQD